MNFFGSKIEEFLRRDEHVKDVSCGVSSGFYSLCQLKNICNQTILKSIHQYPIFNFLEA